jgi:Tfp pilus assembly protein PilX
MIDQKGATIVMVSAIMLFITLISFTGLDFVKNRYKIVLATINQTKSLYGAEAGIQRALYLLKPATPSPPRPTLFPYNETFVFAPYAVQINIQAAVGGENAVLAACTYKGKTTAINAKIKPGTPATTITQWNY